MGAFKLNDDEYSRAVLVAWKEAEATFAKLGPRLLVADPHDQTHADEPFIATQSGVYAHEVERYIDFMRRGIPVGAIKIEPVRAADHRITFRVNDGHHRLVTTALFGAPIRTRLWQGRPSEIFDWDEVGWECDMGPNQNHPNLLQSIKELERLKAANLEAITASNVEAAHSFNLAMLG